MLTVVTMSRQVNEMSVSGNEPPPTIVRSMSDASEFARRGGHFSYGSVLRRGTTSGGRFFASPPGLNHHRNAFHHHNGIDAGTTNTGSRQTETEDEDFDLNMVFDEIEALQVKGLDESGTDDTCTAPLVTPSTTTATVVPHHHSHHHSHHPPAPPPPPPSSHSKSATTTYNSEIYDESDISLANEKYPLNVRYLKDFRCDQCPLFLQHKCTQHKPFTCFHWHFANQRRRRPLRKRDGTFNYSPDVYCTKYDETTGICADGDECPFLHRTAGDTERRYHLRYYKTGMCVYETDSRGFCVKNGAHCAFAHGQHDLRMPVFDVREQNSLADGDTDNSHGLFDKDRNAVNEDPRWQDTAFVLANYKTELCKRPPRLCRQGYACPQYHNNKDRRRSPKKFKYRSTPCPNVKQGDEWGDPVNCDLQDECSYCHTRTEQQFHPEIYKSTKCNDIQQSNFCPRGPFCAFAHSESVEEITAAREFSTDPNSEIPPSVKNTSPVDIARANSLSSYSHRTNMSMQTIASSLPEHFDFGFDLSAPQPPPVMPQHNELNNNNNNHNSHTNSLGPIARPRSYSTSNTKAVEPMSIQALLEKNNLLKGASTGLNSGSTLFSAASSASSLFPSLRQEQHQPPSSLNMSSYYDLPSAQSVTIDSMLSADISLDELDKVIGNSLSNSNAAENHLDAGNASLNSYNSVLRRSSLINECSAPINIPPNRIGTAMNDARSTSASGFNASSPPNKMNANSPLGTSFGLSASNFPTTGRQFSQLANGGGAVGNGGQQGGLFELNLSSQTNGPSLAAAATAPASVVFPNLALFEIQRLRDELAIQKKNYEDRCSQLIQMYRRDLSEANKMEKIAEKTRDEALNILNYTQKELELVRSNDNSSFHQKRLNELNSMSRNQLLALQQRTKQDLTCIEEALQRAQ